MSKQVTHTEFKEMMAAQGHKDNYDVTFQCPSCKTLQTGHDLMKAIGTEDREEVQKYIGFSCVGRFNNEKTGCDWTLGGLFLIHELEVVTDDDEKHPLFMPVTPEEAKQQLTEDRK